MKDSKDIDRLHSTTRFIIFLPLILVIGFLFFNSQSRKENYVGGSQVPDTSQSPANNSVESKDRVASENSAQKFDFAGPMVCAYKDDKTNSTAYIKNKNIYAKQVTSKTSTEFILKGDCFYVWGKDSLNGQKTCGVSQYLDLFTMLSSTSFFDIKTIVPLLLGEKSGVEVPDKVPDLSEICKEGDVDEKWFTIPTNINFQEKKQ